MSFPTNGWRAGAALLLVWMLVLSVAVRPQSGRQQPSQQQPPPEGERQRRTVAAPSSQQQEGEKRGGETPSQGKAAPKDADDDDGDVVRVEADLTNVLMTAMDKNHRFVTTLRQEDIRLFENGVAQTISNFQRETDLPLSLVILIDTSASQEAVLKDEQEAARAFIDAVLRPEKDMAAVVSFTGAIKIEQGLTNDRARLHRGINETQVVYNYNHPVCADNERFPEEQAVLCRTGVWNGIWLTVDELLSKTPEHTRRAIILLSDGDDTSGQTTTIVHTDRREAIEYAVQHNTSVYSIGIRDEDFPDGHLDRDALRKVSEQTGGRAFFPKSREELTAAFAQIEQELRSQYLVSYTPTNRARDNTFRQIKIEIANPELRKQKLRLLYRQGYYARRRDGSR